MRTQWIRHWYLIGGIVGTHGLEGAAWWLASSRHQPRMSTIFLQLQRSSGANGFDICSGLQVFGHGSAKSVHGFVGIGISEAHWHWEAETYPDQAILSSTSTQKERVHNP